jgi:WD40 repeat protein
MLPQDLTADGRLLAKATNNRREIIGITPGDSRERNLTWLDWSYPDDISDDGRTILFDEQSRGRANYLCYIRKTDGSPAVLLGRARGFGLSPDGRWALTVNPDASQLTLLPTGPGSPQVLPKSGLIYQWGSFLPDGKRLLLTASEPGRGARIYVQDLNGGKPRAITPEGYSNPQRASSPDGRMVAAIGPDRKIQLCSISGDKPRPLPGAREDEHALGWTGDGKFVYLGLMTNPARIDLCDVSTGERRLWKEIVPPDPAGVLAIGPILVTPDGKNCVYSYRRLLDDLFLVTGLK